MKRRLYAVLALLSALTLSACSHQDEEASSAVFSTGDREALANGDVAPGSPQEFIRNIADTVYFDTNSFTLSSASMTVLDRYVTWMNANPSFVFVLEGHADERGTREYNFALSSKRAETVRRYLMDRGVGDRRLSVSAFGKERPVAACHAIECWQLNRRVESLILEP